MLSFSYRRPQKLYKPEAPKNWILPCHRVPQTYCHSQSCDSESSTTSLHFPHFFCFVESFKNDLRTPFSHFIFCRTLSCLQPPFYLSLPSTTCLVTLVIEKVTGNKSNKVFCETGFSTTCHLSLPHQETCHLSYLSLHDTRP